MTEPPSAYRVLQDFAHDGVAYYAGRILRADHPAVADCPFPHFLAAEPGPAARPRRPRRDWLAEAPIWRIP